MITSYVYMHTNIKTGQFYIGFRMRNVVLNIYPSDDLTKYICSSKLVKNMIMSNVEDWHSEIIACFFNPTDAFWFEQELIEFYWKNKLLLNKQYKTKTSKIFLSYKMSDSHKSKISKSLKGVPKSIDHRIALSKSHMGNKLSDVSIAKSVAKNTGKIRNSEQRARISNGLIGHVVTDITKQKISKSNKGKPGLKGRRSPTSKPFICIENNITYYSQPEAACALHLRQGDINNVLNGRQRTTKGYTFKFL